MFGGLSMLCNGKPHGLTPMSTDSFIKVSPIVPWTMRALYLY